jgi:transposase
MKEEQESTRKSTNSSHNQGGYTIKSLAYKRKVLAEYNNREISQEEFCKQYNISPTSIRNWQLQIERAPEDLKSISPRPHHTEGFKLQVVKEVVMGGLSFVEAQKKYNIASRNTVVEWCKRYSDQIGGIKIQSPMKKNKEDSPQPQDDRIAQLEKALEDSNLKNLALETMINIAEKELKINIRKKSGTKQ